MRHLKLTIYHNNLALSVAVLALSLLLTGRSEELSPAANTLSAKESVLLPKSVPDPIEPFNRVMWSFNKGLMTDVIKPTSRVYRAIVVKPVRKSIGHFGRNLTYPGRLINNLLQQKWAGARDESYRFVCNSTVGLGGLFDVSSRWHIPKSDADFGQTFGQWGWQPKCFIMLPFFGPSNERDTVGLAADTAANPLLYFAPFGSAENDPFTYIGGVVAYNGLSDTVNEYVRFSQAEMDPYSEIEYAWTFARQNRVADFEVKGKPDEATLETIESVFFTYKDPEFPSHGKTKSVTISATGRKLKFTYWLQPGSANVVYIIPGMGGHRLAQPSLALAELVFKNGFSAVVVSSPFNSEFMENASTAPLPAYLPVDGHDLHVALTEIDQRLKKLYPNRLGNEALMGYSMGALESLYIAATEQTNQLPLLKFDRYVAINTPVRLLHGVSKLDEFYRAPLAWPVGKRTDNLDNTFLKVADLSKNTLTPQTSLPFDAIESKFLIGLDFRLILRDIIYSSQRRNNQHVLQLPIHNLRRDPVYQEILTYSYADYFEKFVVPSYSRLGDSVQVAHSLDQKGDLRNYSDGLRINPNVRIVVNQNDFLLEDEDLAWLHTTFAPDRLTVFSKGGHLGNLSNPTVQNAILAALTPMRPPAVSNGP